METANATIQGEAEKEVAVDGVVRDEDGKLVDVYVFRLNQSVQLGAKKVDVHQRYEGAIAGHKHHGRPYRHFNRDRSELPRVLQERVPGIIAVAVMGFL